MRVSIIAPVKDEVQFIGYSIMSVLPYVHEIIYACAKSNDGTDDLLDYIKDKHAKEKLVLLRDAKYDFDPHNMKDYNKSFNDCVERATGDACWFLHPDMIAINPENIAHLPEGDTLAWWTNLRSYARDFSTLIIKGRNKRWKNIHKKEFGLHYYGGYGSVNEDFYHSDITGADHMFYGENFGAYPFDVADSGLLVNHYCEMKPYERRLDKMKKCLKTLEPRLNEKQIHDMAKAHPRVTLEDTTEEFGKFEFKNLGEQPPPIFSEYENEFAMVLGGKVEV